MIGAGALQIVAVADIELDRFNPRIRKFLEMYGDNPTPEQFYLALGAGGDEEGGATSTTFEKLKNSIIMNGGVIQPVMLNKLEDGKLVCIDGNTRVALYKNFVTEEAGNWSNILALVYDNLDENGVDAVRLQAVRERQFLDGRHNRAPGRLRQSQTVCEGQVHSKTRLQVGDS